jgi:ribosomal protein L10
LFTVLFHCGHLSVCSTAKALSKREPSLPLSAVQEVASQASVDKALLGIQHPLGKAIVHAKVVADHAISSANELSNMFPGVQSSPEVKQVTTGGRKPLVVRPASSSRLRPASASIPLKRTPSVL